MQDMKSRHAPEKWETRAIFSPECWVEIWSTEEEMLGGNNFHPASTRFPTTLVYLYTYLCILEYPHTPTYHSPIRRSLTVGTNSSPRTRGHDECSITVWGGRLDKIVSCLTTPFHSPYWAWCKFVSYFMILTKSSYTKVLESKKQMNMSRYLYQGKIMFLGHQFTGMLGIFVHVESINRRQAISEAMLSYYSLDP